MASCASIFISGGSCTPCRKQRRKAEHIHHWAVLFYLEAHRFARDISHTCLSLPRCTTSRRGRLIDNRVTCRTGRQVRSGGRLSQYRPSRLYLLLVNFWRRILIRPAEKLAEFLPSHHHLLCFGDVYRQGGRRPRERIVKNLEKLRDDKVTTSSTLRHLDADESSLESGRNAGLSSVSTCHLSSSQEPCRKVTQALRRWILRDFQCRWGGEGLSPLADTKRATMTARRSQ